MLSRKIGIDLGTSTMRIFVKGEGVVINERSPIEFERDSPRTLHHLIGMASGRPRLFKPDVIVSVPSAVTSGERRRVTEAAISAGARQVWLIDEPLAAAMGAGLPIGELRASAICEIGAATTEIAVIAHSGTVIERSIRVGGYAIDRAIASRLLISEGDAEEVKIAVGSAMPMDQPLVMHLGSVEISSNQIVEAIEEPIHRIAAAIRDVLDETPADLADDIRDRGIVLSGGGAQLRGLDRYISMRAGIPAKVAEEPQTSVVRGTGMALENFEVLKRNQSYLR